GALALGRSALLSARRQGNRVGYLPDAEIAGVVVGRVNSLRSGQLTNLVRANIEIGETGVSLQGESAALSVASRRGTSRIGFAISLTNTRICAPETINLT
ncbi:MAG: hypothetical protein U1G07_25605, partial [Verrucomicrobiota bacterium]